MDENIVCIFPVLFTCFCCCCRCLPYLWFNFFIIQSYSKDCWVDQVSRYGADSWVQSWTFSMTCLNLEKFLWNIYPTSHWRGNCAHGKLSGHDLSQLIQVFHSSSINCWPTPSTNVSATFSYIVDSPDSPAFHAVVKKYTLICQFLRLWHDQLWQRCECATATVLGWW